MEKWKQSLANEIVKLKMADTDPKYIRELQSTEDGIDKDKWSASARAMPTQEYMDRFQPYKRYHCIGIIRMMGGIAIEMDSPSDEESFSFDMNDAESSDEVSTILRSSTLAGIIDLVWEHKAKHLFT
tara:strand:+ start:328 stop:708 length:381 start_codon:yes stop_codon:yes gene_type:complete